MGPLELGQNGELLGCPLGGIWVEDVLDQMLHFGGHSPTGGPPSTEVFLKLAHRPQWETLLPTHRYLYIGTYIHIIGSDIDIFNTLHGLIMVQSEKTLAT